MMSLAVSGIYRPRINVQFLDDIRSIVGATALAAMIVTFVRVIVSDDVHTAAQAVRHVALRRQLPGGGRGAATGSCRRASGARACGRSRR